MFVIPWAAYIVHCFHYNPKNEIISKINGEAISNVKFDDVTDTEVKLKHTCDFSLNLKIVQHFQYKKDTHYLIYTKHNLKAVPATGC